MDDKEIVLSGNAYAGLATASFHDVEVNRETPGKEFSIGFICGVWHS